MKSRFVLQATALCFVAFSWIGCDKNDDDDTNQTEDRLKISGTASGAQEVPAANTPATGTVTGTYHTEDNMLEYTVTWSNLTANAKMMHFHGPADPGTNANVMIPITGFDTTASGTYSGMATLNASQDSALRAGKMYYNVHTATYPGGEIRAQVTATAD